MRPDERFRAPWGIAFYGSFLVFLLVLGAEFARLSVELWARDDVPVLVDVLFPLGTALLVTGTICAMIPCIRWQVRGVLTRPRDGLLALGLPRSIHPFVILVSAGALTFLAGGIAGAIDLVLNTSAPRVGIAGFVVVLGGIAWLAFVILRLTRIRFVADGWGLRWDNPVLRSSTQLPWEQISSVDLRGSRLLAMRIVATTIDGRSRMVWLLDTSIPVSKASFRALVAEIVGLRPPVPASPS